MKQLCRDVESKIPSQIGAILRERILAGCYANGKRMPSVRSLSQEFSASPVTMVKALGELESEGIVRRVERQGVFVSLPEKTPERVLRFSFCFPPQKFEPEVIGTEEWALASEFYRGMLAGASQSNADVSFLQLPETVSNTAELNAVKERLKPFDMNIFVNGTPYGLSLLAQSLSGAVPLLLLRHTSYEKDTAPLIEYDRKLAVAMLADQLARKGVRSVGAIAIKHEALRGRDRAQHFLDACSQRGISVAPQYYWLINDFASPNGQQELEAHFRSAQIPEVIFCDLAPEVERIERIAANCNVRLGRDFQITGICSGLSFRNWRPDCGYIRVPRYEMGFGAIQIAAAALREGRSFTFPEFPPQLVCASDNKEQ